MKNMTVHALSTIESFFKKHGDLVLTIISTAGVAAVALSASKAGVTSVNKIDMEERKKERPLTTSERFKTVFPIYIPTILFTGLTIGSVMLSYTTNKKRTLALISAYGMLNESYTEYKRQTIQNVGASVESKITDDIVVRRFDDDALRDKIMASPDSILCYDMNSSTYFESTLTKLIMAEYQFNRMLSYKEMGSLNDFYELLGISPISGGDIVGWLTLPQGLQYEAELIVPWVDFAHDQVVVDNGQLECTVISTPLKPIDLMAYYNFTRN